MENKEIDENTHTYDNGFHPKNVTLKEGYTFYHTDLPFRIINHITVRITQFFIFFHKTLVLGYKVKGRKNRKYMKGSFIICNHIHPVDALLQVSTINKPKTYVTALQSNLGFGIVSKYFRAGGCVPIPESLNLFRDFIAQTNEIISKGGNIIFYPEAALQPYCDHIRNFKNGVFQFAVGANATIIPCVITFHKPKGIYKLFRKKKPCLHYNILEPYHIIPQANKKLTIEKAKNDVHKIMNDYFINNSDYYKKTTK